MTPTAPRGSQAGAALDLLRRNADFRNLFLSSVVSFLGDWFALVAVAGLIRDLTGSDGATAVVFAAQTLPIFFFAPLAGVLADRVDRKKLMIVADVLRIPPALLLVVASVTGQAWLAFAGVATISMLAAFSQPVPAAVVPNLVDREDLSLAVAMMGSVWGTMLFLGAAIGGLAAATLGRELAFVLDATTFAVSALLLLRVRRPFNAGTVSTAGAGVVAHLGEIWAFVRPRKISRALMLTKSGVGFGNGIIGLLPLYAIDRFGAGDAGTGVLLAARGLGALIGPYLGRRLIGGSGHRLVWICGGSIVVFGLTYLLLPLAPSLAIAAMLIFLAHLGGGNQWVASTEGLQRTTPDHVRGRVMSLDFGLATLAIGVSTLVAGGVAEVFGIGATTVVIALVPVLYGAWWLVWTRDLWAGPADPLAVSEDLPEETAL